MTLRLPEFTPAEEILAFLDDIEGDGYGGMVMFEVARQHAREMVAAEKALLDPTEASSSLAQGDGPTRLAGTGEECQPLYRGPDEPNALPMSKREATKRFMELMSPPASPPISSKERASD